MSSTEPPDDSSRKSVIGIADSSKFAATTPLLMAQALLKDAVEERVFQLVIVFRDGAGGVHISWDDDIDTASLTELAMGLRLETERAFAMAQAEIDSEVANEPPGD